MIGSRRGYTLSRRHEGEVAASLRDANPAAGRPAHDGSEEYHARHAGMDDSFHVPSPVSSRSL